HWFNADWRLDIYDDLMLDTLARIADDHIGLLPASRQLSDRFLRKIAWYGDQNFLIKGDGRTLMGAFGFSALLSRHQARLDAILKDERFDLAGPAGHVPTIEGAGLSASSSSPISIDPGNN
ncbi:MAG: hypothetical protein ACR2RE_29630, partial [Geminicoccaceae bacterium]